MALTNARVAAAPPVCTPLLRGCVTRAHDPHLTRRRPPSYTQAVAHMRACTRVLASWRGRCQGRGRRPSPAAVRTPLVGAPALPASLRSPCHPPPPGGGGGECSGKPPRPCQRGLHRHCQTSQTRHPNPSRRPLSSRRRHQPEAGRSPSQRCHRPRPRSVM